MHELDGMHFDRQDAAYELVKILEDFEGQNPLVLGVPRGAIPMAKIIADKLGGELDIVLVKKIGHPSNPEFALGSVAEDGEIFLGLGALEHSFSIKDLEIRAARIAEQLREKRAAYTHDKPPSDPKNRIVIIVDDGIATGATMTAAVKYAKHKGAKRVVVATPVVSEDAQKLLLREGAEVRALEVPKYFGAVSLHYRNFQQVSDAEVGKFF